MAACLSTICDVLDSRFPVWLAEPWDRVGLVTGDPAHEVHKVCFAVDPVAAAVDEALEWGADLLVVHHPLLLRPVASVAATTFKGAVIHRLIESGCGLYTAHTNADAARHGTADALCDALGLTVCGPLVPHAMDPSQGLGRVGEFTQPQSLGDFAGLVARTLPATAHGVRVAGDLTASIRRVAVVPGAGDDLFDEVRAARADVFLTADLRHHPASEARERADFDGRGRPYLVDVSHSASEWHWLASAAQWLERSMSDHGDTVVTKVISRVADPWSARVDQL